MNGRERKKAKAKEDLVFWTNAALSLVKQLWKGKFNDDLVRQAAEGFQPWENVKESSSGRALTLSLRERVQRTLETRPADFPRGAGAIRRQLGTSLKACPTAKEKGEKLPKRGDIWPARVENISLLPSGTEPTYIGRASKEIEDLLITYRESMLKDPKEVAALRERVEEACSGTIWVGATAEMGASR